MPSTSQTPPFESDSVLEGVALQVFGDIRHFFSREITRKLTPREIEVARMIAKGLPNKAVADRLRISEGTAKLHLHHVYAKLGLDGRMALAQYLQSRGLD